MSSSLTKPKAAYAPTVPRSPIVVIFLPLMRNGGLAVDVEN
jgi:hypothetical protein